MAHASQHSRQQVSRVARGMGRVPGKGYGRWPEMPGFVGSA